MKIKKVINNNIVCAIDKSGNELIVTGKGIGYKRVTGQPVEESAIEKIYCMEERDSQKKLRELVSQIPLEHLDITQEMIRHICEVLGHKVNESLLITLADHISFAIKRKEQGIEFSHPLRTSIMCYYPTEYSLGQDCLDIMERRLKVRLCEDEASFIALHIVNAQLNMDMTGTYKMTEMMNGCVRIVEKQYAGRFDRDSLDFSRFAVHLRYLIQRLYQNQLLQDKMNEEDAAFRELIRRTCPSHYRCAQKIADYIEAEYGTMISEEEKIYVTIHLKRLNISAVQGGDDNEM